MEGIPTGGQAEGLCQGSEAASHAQPALHSWPPTPPPAPAAAHPALTAALHHLVELALNVQLGVLRLHTLQLDGDFLTRGDVGTCPGWGGKGPGSPSKARQSQAPHLAFLRSGVRWARGHLPLRSSWGRLGSGQRSPGKGFLRGKKVSAARDRGDTQELLRATGWGNKEA